MRCLHKHSPLKVLPQCRSERVLFVVVLNGAEGKQELCSYVPKSYAILLPLPIISLLLIGVYN